MHRSAFLNSHSIVRHAVTGALLHFQINLRITVFLSDHLVGINTGYSSDIGMTICQACDVDPRSDIRSSRHSRCITHSNALPYLQHIPLPSENIALYQGAFRGGTIHQFQTGRNSIDQGHFAGHTLTFIADGHVICDLVASLDLDDIRSPAAAVQRHRAIDFQHRQTILSRQHFIGLTGHGSFRVSMSIGHIRAVLVFPQVFRVGNQTLERQGLGFTGCHLLKEPTDITTNQCAALRHGAFHKRHTVRQRVVHFHIRRSAHTGVDHIDFISNHVTGNHAYITVGECGIIDLLPHTHSQNSRTILFAAGLVRPNNHRIVVRVVRSVELYTSGGSPESRRLSTGIVGFPCGTLITQGSDRSGFHLPQIPLNAFRSHFTAVGDRTGNQFQFFRNRIICHHMMGRTFTIVVNSDVIRDFITGIDRPIFRSSRVAVDTLGLAHCDGRNAVLNSVQSIGVHDDVVGAGHMSAGGPSLLLAVSLGDNNRIDQSHLLIHVHVPYIPCNSTFALIICTVIFFKQRTIILDIRPVNNFQIIRYDHFRLNARCCYIGDIRQCNRVIQRVTGFHLNSVSGRQTVVHSLRHFSLNAGPCFNTVALNENSAVKHRILKVRQNQFYMSHRIRFHITVRSVHQRNTIKAASLKTLIDFIKLVIGHLFLRLTILQTVDRHDLIITAVHLSDILAVDKQTKRIFIVFLLVKLVGREHIVEHHHVAAGIHVKLQRNSIILLRAVGDRLHILILIFSAFKAALRFLILTIQRLSRITGGKNNTAALDFDGIIILMRGRTFPKDMIFFKDIDLLAIRQRQLSAPGHQIILVYQQILSQRFRRNVRCRIADMIIAARSKGCHTNTRQCHRCRHQHTQTGRKQFLCRFHNKTSFGIF